jgi:hypothetical protein
MLKNKGCTPSPCPSPHGRGDAAAAVQSVSQPAKLCLEKRTAMSWFVTGVLAGLALFLLVAEQGRDRGKGGSQSYYSQF